MSGLLESIARRRRASASRRLGPPPEAEASGAGTSHGAAPEAAQANGSARWAPVSKLAPGAVAPPAPEPTEPEPEPVATPQPAPEPVEQATVEDKYEPEPEPQPKYEPEPEPEPEALQPTPDPSAPDSVPPTASGFLQRGRVRRRARYLRQLRELQLRDLGGFMVELQRHGRRRPDLVQAKLAEAVRTDEELRGLDRALGTDQPLRELREAGIGGACGHCGALHGSRDKFCASCGEPLGRAANARPPDAE